MKEIMEILLENGREHPARSMSFEDLENGLMDEVKKGTVNVSYHPEFSYLAIFKYSIDCVSERLWNIFSLMSRGLILDLKNKQVVATPFIKFFNYGEIEEGSHSVIDSDFVVTEKMDGSLGIVFFAEEKWRVATCGSFISEQAKWGEKWLYENVDLSLLDKTNTYLFEIIYPENKIVISYDFSGMVLLSIIDKFGMEYAYDQLKRESGDLKVRVAKQYDFSDMTSILSQTKDLDKDHEGYVIRFKNGVRLKVKGDEYVRIHRLMSKVTPLFIWASMLEGDDLNEIKKGLPEEMSKDFDNISSILSNRLESFNKEVELLYENTKHMSDKALGIMMSEHPEFFAGGEFKEAVKYIFPMRKGKFIGPLADPSSILRRRVFSIFKPKSNFLKGYVPSSLTNRFVDDL